MTRIPDEEEFAVPVRPPPGKGIGPAEVEEAAIALLRGGERPTTERVRKRIGRGSPNTIAPFLDAWWGKLFEKFRQTPAAEFFGEAATTVSERMPLAVASAAERLFIEALIEVKSRAETHLNESLPGLQRRERELANISLTLGARDREQSIAISNLTELNHQLRAEVSALNSASQSAADKLAHAERKISELQTFIKIFSETGATGAQLSKSVEAKRPRK
jgi:hypothetical protein